MYSFTQAERTVLTVFAQHWVDDSYQLPVTIGQLFVRTGLAPAELKSPLDSLIHRGWVVCSAPLDCTPDDHCMLTQAGSRVVAWLASQNGSTQPSTPKCSKTERRAGCREASAGKTDSHPS
ncbi:MAG: hypothetical protein H7Y88_07695 [Phycisphaerales bacterium]|nr:hypothetical protein [Phycisphaerales bacterium]